jgi:hypothetical protein
MQQQIKGNASDGHFCHSMFEFVLTSTIFALLLLNDVCESNCNQIDQDNQINYA